MKKFDAGLHYPLDFTSLPRGWMVDYVGEFLASIQPGFACGQHNMTGEGIAHLRPMNVSRDGRVDLSDLRFVSRDADERRLNVDDVLFNNTNSPELIGKTAYVGVDGRGLAFSNHMTRMQFNAAVNPKFAALQLHFLWMMKYFLHRCLKHVNQASVSSGDLARTVPLLVPPQREQRRIVAKIEELFSELNRGAENLKIAQAQLKTYRLAALKQAFAGKVTTAWRDVHLDSLEASESLLSRIHCERETRYAKALHDWRDAVTAWRDNGEIGRKPNKPTLPEYPEDFDFTQLPPLPPGWAYVPFGALTNSLRNGISQKPDEAGALKIFRISAVRPMSFDLTDFRHVEDNEENRSYKLRRGDLVFTRYNGSRAYVGVAALYKGDESHVYPDKLIRCDVASDAIEAGFLEKAVNCGESRAFIETRIRTTAGQAGISGGDLKAMPVAVCSREEQTLINRILEAQLSQISQLEADVEAGLQKIDALRQAILKKAFSGHLVPQDARDEPASVVLKHIKAEKDCDGNGRKKKSTNTKEAA